MNKKQKNQMYLTATKKWITLEDRFQSFKMFFKQRSIYSTSYIFTQHNVDISIVWCLTCTLTHRMWSIMTTKKCLMMSPSLLSSTLYDNWFTSIMPTHWCLMMSPSLLLSIETNNCSPYCMTISLSELISIHRIKCFRSSWNSFCIWNTRVNKVHTVA